MNVDDFLRNEDFKRKYENWSQSICELFKIFLSKCDSILPDYDAFIVKSAKSTPLRFGFKNLDDKSGKVFFRVKLNSSNFGIKIDKSICNGIHPDASIINDLEENDGSFIISNLNTEFLLGKTLDFLKQVVDTTGFIFPTGRDGYVPSDYLSRSNMEIEEGSMLGNSLKFFAKPDLNQILFGPPGTGKTYNTIDEALNILDQDYLKANRSDRKLLKERFEQLLDAGRIRFVTFHQSFSYEDFVEGLKAESRDNGSLCYKVVDGLFKQICQRAEEDSDSNPYVLIIDEINRGNISRIFGELITLLESSKRLGAEEELKVQLPYSKDEKLFGVPGNLYVIGTMNTADRSLAGLDLALRRRFFFKEMPPRPELLDDVEGIDIGELLRIINLRITALLGRDYCLGHAIFMPLQKDKSLPHLSRIFQKQVLPLLQEYFFEDWQKIALVLNDHRKPKGDRFVTKDENLDPHQLFGDESELGNLPLGWKIKPEGDMVWTQTSSYMGIIDHNWRKVEQAAEAETAQ